MLHKQKATPEQFGITFLKRQSNVEIKTLKRVYFDELGLKLGHIQLEYQKKNNLEIVAKALFNIQAQGRRKTIRALCSSACTYKLDYEKESFSGSLQDISLSHFSILVKDSPLPIKLYEKVHDIHFNIRGSFFHSDAILVMQRPVGTANLYVFAFVTPAGANGLDERTKSLLVPVLYSMISVNCIGLLEKHYHDDDGKKEQAEEAATETAPEAPVKVKISAEQEMDPEIAALGEEPKNPEE